MPKGPKGIEAGRTPTRRSGVADGRAERERLARLDHLPPLDYPEAMRIRSTIAGLARRVASGASVPPVLLYGTADNGRTTLARALAGTARGWAGGHAVVTSLQPTHQEPDARMRPGPRGRPPRFVVVDGCDALADARPRDRRLAFAHLQAMAAEGIVVMAVCGGRLVAKALLDADRVGPVERCYLPRWPMGPDFLTLLRGLERQCDLREPSRLDRGDLALRLHAASDGRLGVLTRTVRGAAAAAIQSGTERITSRLLEDLGISAGSGPD